MGEEANFEAGGWKRVSFSAEADEDGNCALCGEEYAECGCPGPTQDGYEYTEVEGVLYAREEKGEQRD